jgi:hypothetical protein
MGHAVKVKSWDLSLRNMKCNNNPAFKQDTPCEIKIVLSPEIGIKTIGEILQITENYTAVFFKILKKKVFII